MEVDNTVNIDDDPDQIKRQIRHSITRFLARREHSCVELIRKLKQKDYEHEMILEGLAPFIKRGLQSDHRYAEVFVRSCFEKGKGPAYIEQSLQQHDIESYTIKTLIQDEAYDWYEAAFRVRAKRFGEPLPSEWDDVQKQKRFLQYRGFSQTHIKEVFS